MKTLEELNEEYRSAELALSAAKNLYMVKVAELKAAIVQYAKYKVGEKVFYVRKIYNGRHENIPGIVRTIKAKNYYSEDPILPCYEVGKITKSGAIHASQNIHYSEIYESEMEPFAE